MITTRNKSYQARYLLMVAIFLAGFGNPVAATLLGVELAPPPSAIVLYNNAGTTTYDAGTDLFSVDASPLGMNSGGSISVISPIPGGAEGVDINISVDETGSLIGGVPGDDLVVFGEVVLGAETFTGPLLTGEITDFGFSDTGGPTDLFDFLFTTTGGLLTDLFGANIGVTLTSESSSFTGVFSADFTGEAKGNIGTGSIPPTDTIPEPATLVLFGVGLAGLGFARRRKK